MPLALANAIPVESMIRIAKEAHPKCVRSGLVWSGLVWSGLVWSGLVWSKKDQTLRINNTS